MIASNDHLIGLLRAGRAYFPAAAEMPSLTERALIGALTSVIGNRLMQDQADRLPGIADELVQLTLVPYVGSEEAHRLATAALKGLLSAETLWPLKHRLLCVLRS